MTKEITKKEIKVINDLNQIVKNLFARYYLFGDGFIIADERDEQLKGGFHFAISPVAPTVLTILGESENIVSLDSKLLYTTVRDHKKDITGVSLSYNGINLTTVDLELLVGLRIQMNDMIARGYQKAKERYSELEFAPLPIEMIQTLIDNRIVTYSDGDYKVRITKELIPNIKKDLPLSVAFLPTDEENVFETIISMQKDEVKSFHVYKCIKY